MNSLPSERDNRLSAFNPEMRSKTENLERLLVEVERQGSGAASDQGGSTSSLGKREVRQYIRSVTELSSSDQINLIDYTQAEVY